MNDTHPPCKNISYIDVTNIKLDTRNEHSIILKQDYMEIGVHKLGSKHDYTRLNVLLKIIKPIYWKNVHLVYHFYIVYHGPRL